MRILAVLFSSSPYLAGLLVGRPELLDWLARTADHERQPERAELAAEIAGRARGTPRIVNNLIHFTRDYAEQRAEGAINAKVAAEALELLAIDSNGLDEMDKRIIRCMGENHNGGPVGLSTIAVAVSEEENTIEEVHEPFLIQEGYLRRTPQGRVLTERGWAISGIAPPDETGQMNLI